MKNILKSIGAFVTAIAITSVLSYGTDAIMMAIGLMPQSGLPSSAALVLVIIAYRTVYNVLGAYVLAKLAPSHPWRHVWVLGAFGVLGSIAATMSITDTNHAWYGWVLTVLVLPSIWLGAKLAEHKKK